jgi:clan AA aspartic protease (TIGR02281 family)
MISIATRRADASRSVACSLFFACLIGCSDQNTGNVAANQPPASVQSTPTAAGQTPPTVNPATAQKVPTVDSSTEVPLEDDNGTFLVPVRINDAISLKFTIDSGASDVSIPSDVASTLVRAGTISAGDYIGSGTAVLADGTEVPSYEFRIRSLRVGTLVLHDVTATITGSSGSLLLGQSFLTRLQNWSIDNNRHVLVLNAVQGSQVATEDPRLSRTPMAGDGNANGSDGAVETSTASLGTSAGDTVQRYFAAWSNPADADGQSVRQFYAEAVDYYGKQLSLPEVMGEKLRFARQWPFRTYTIRANSLRTQCSDQTRACKVAGLVDWRASSDAQSRHSSGTATFLLILNDGLIVSEHSRVISRELSGGPSFDCAKARSSGAIAVCSNANLAALDRDMAAQYSRAFANASPAQQQSLRETSDRFNSDRNRCSDDRCVRDAYAGRIREIRDIMDGSWPAPR